MSFNPINKQEETEHEIEEHIREVELENAVKLYQEALRAHHRGDLDEAAVSYEQLIESSILQDAANKAPTVTRRDAPQLQSSAAKLPALVYRNHATLLLQRIQQQGDSSPQHAQAVLRAVLASYATALSFDPDDTLLWRQTLQLGEALQMPQVQRIALETLLDSAAVTETATRGLFWQNAADPYAEAMQKKLDGLVSTIYKAESLLSLTETSMLSVDLISSARALNTARNALEPEVVVVQVEEASALAIGNQILRHYTEHDTMALSVQRLFKIEASAGSARPSVDSLMLEAPVDLQVPVISVADERQTDAAETGTPIAEDQDASIAPVADDNTNPAEPDASHAAGLKRTRDDDAASVHTVPPSPKRAKVTMNLTGETGQLFFSECLRRLFDPLNVDFSTFLALDSEALREEDEPIVRARPTPFDDLKQFLYLDWSDEVYLRSTADEPAAEGDAFAASMMFSFPEIVRPEREPPVLWRSMQSLLGQEPQSLRAVGLAWIQALLSSAEAPYLQVTWSTRLMEAVWRILAVDESLLLRHVSQARIAKAGIADNATLDALYLAQAVLELQLDQLAAERKADLTNAEVDDAAQCLLESAQRWYGKVRTSLYSLSDEVKDVAIRSAWAQVRIRQLSGATPEELAEDFVVLREIVGDSSIILPNATTAQHIDADKVDLEIQKFKTMGFFNQIFHNHASGNHDAILKQLKPILLPSGELSSQDLLVYQYLQRAPATFRLQLWRLLAETCFASGNCAEGLFVSITSLEQLNQSLVHPDQALLQTDVRQQYILRVLHESGNVVEKAAHLVSLAILEALDYQQCVRCLQSLMTFGSLCMVATYYDDHIAEFEKEARETRAAFECKRLLSRRFVEFWVLVYHLFARALSARPTLAENAGAQLGSLLSTLHEELGTRKYCGLADGLLLELLENEVYRLNRVEMENDLVQVLHCRYDLGFAVGSFWPWEHGATPIEVSMENAIRMMPFLLTMVTQRTPGMWLPKIDLRNVLEKIHEKLWLPLKTDEIRVRNAVILDTFLESEIVPKAFTQCISGGVLLPFQELTPQPNVSKEHWLGYRDLNLVLGRIHLSIYKLKNKQATGAGKGVDDLEIARQYFTCDITVQPSRVESWRSLAFTYGVLADYELSLDAERIASNKEHICELRRSTLLCSMMAVSVAIQQARRGEQEEGLTEVAFCDLLYEFGLQIYSAARDPFGMAVFERQALRYLQRGYESPREEQVPGVTFQMALRVACKCLTRAARTCTTRWSCLLLLGKAHAKLKLNPAIPLNDFSEAIKAAPAERISSAGFYGPLIEPDYRLVSSVAKYLLEDDLSPAEAVLFLENTPFSKGVLPAMQNLSRDSVLEAIPRILQAIRAADKKQWHHRPVHRQAQLLLQGYGSFELEEDVPATPEKLAQACLESLFTAKGSGSNLLSIWRPDTERPGRHFVYAQRYTVLYVSLLVKQNDFEGLKNFMRRSRKAMTNILDHKQVWEDMCTQLISMMLDANDIETGLQEGFLQDLMSDVFAPPAKRLEQVVALPDFVQPSLYMMRELYDLRKLNGGLYETAEIDDVIIDCYISLYRMIDDMTDAELGIEVEEPVPVAGTTQAEPSVPGAPPSPSQIAMARRKARENRVVKVTRKDVLNRAFTLCKPRVLPPADSRPRPEGRTSGRLAGLAETAEEGIEAGITPISAASPERVVYSGETDANDEAVPELTANEGANQAIVEKASGANPEAEDQTVAAVHSIADTQST